MGASDLGQGRDEFGFAVSYFPLLKHQSRWGPGTVLYSIWQQVPDVMHLICDCPALADGSARLLGSLIDRLDTSTLRAGLPHPYQQPWSLGHASW